VVLLKASLVFFIERRHFCQIEMRVAGGCIQAGNVFRSIESEMKTAGICLIAEW
jgi:hypothetical protein